MEITINTNIMLKRTRHKYRKLMFINDVVLLPLLILNTVKSQLQATPVYKPYPHICGQYMGNILVAIDKLHR